MTETDSTTSLSNDSALRALTRARRRNFALVVGAFLLGGLVLPNLRVSWSPPWSRADSVNPLGVAPGAPMPLSPAEVYANAAKEAGRAVVNIDTRQRVAVRPNIFGELWDGPQPRFRDSVSQGSGVIINKQGDILTNEHVVGAVGEAGKEITVTLQDGRTFKGQVVGSDRLTDVALVRIPPPADLPVARIGTVKGLAPGQMAVAIGNPLGLRFTVTQGVISATDRPLYVDGRLYENMVQTDCAINSGNSGGPLVDMNGRVIGINTVVWRGSEGGSAPVEGIGFAIPVDTALRVAGELKRYGKVKRPWLGLMVMTNTPYIVSRYDVPNVKGAVIGRCMGPAREAGLQPGDVIVKIDGKPVASQEDVQTMERALRIGQKVTIVLQRGEERGTGTITVGEAP